MGQQALIGTDEKGWTTDRERENSNAKTLFHKDCSLGLVKDLSNERLGEREGERESEREGRRGRMWGYKLKITLAVVL